MTPQEIADKLSARFAGVPDIGIEAKLDNPVDPFIKISPDHILDVTKFLRDDEEMLFDFLSCLSGVDLKGRLAVVYQIFSMVKKHKITLKVEVPTDAPNVQSVESIWKTANWHEREIYDMMGIRFNGHPDLRRILMPGDWPGHPQRKDYPLKGM